MRTKIAKMGPNPNPLLGIAGSLLGKVIVFRTKALSLQTKSEGISYEDVGARNIPTLKLNSQNNGQFNQNR